MLEETSSILAAKDPTNPASRGRDGPKLRLTSEPIPSSSSGRCVIHMPRGVPQPNTLPEHPSLSMPGSSTLPACCLDFAIAFMTHSVTPSQLAPA